MADRIGDSKNGDMGLTGPKRNPLKQTPPANAREYYNSKVPGVNNWKTKTLSHSPSVEPIDHELSPAEQSIKYANPTHIQTTQDHSKENTKRPTTPTTNTTLVTDTTPCTKCTLQFNFQEEDNKYMHSKPCNIKQAIAAAARAKLDYVKINECMSNILQDVKDIMIQQVFDIFQLSSWVARIISMFELKVCNKQEWTHFNRHFNCETGEVTASNSTKTIYTPYDTPITSN